MRWLKSGVAREEEKRNYKRQETESQISAELEKLGIKISLRGRRRKNCNSKKLREGTQRSRNKREREEKR